MTAEDKREILALFPDDTHILDVATPNARPNLESLKNDDNFRHDAEQYVSNLGKGMHDPVWLKDAWTAHHRRAAGDFDAYYIRKLEIDWNTTIPDEYKPEHLRSKKNGQASSSAGHSVQGKVIAGESLDDPAVASNSGSSPCMAALPRAENTKAETTPPKSSNGTSDVAESVAASPDNSSMGNDASLVRAIDGELVKSIHPMKTNRIEVIPNGAAHIAAEGSTNGDTEKATNSNEAKLIAVGGDADTPRHSMDVGDSEYPDQTV